MSIMPGNYVVTDIKYFKFRDTVITIYQAEIDKCWRDIYGTLYGLTDDGSSIDSISRCGIGLFSLPLEHPANLYCDIHDKMYSMPAYQLFNSRKEADKALYDGLKQGGFWFSSLFYRISRWFGGRFWENKDTNN